jgi:peptidoglycan/xylan/chitin deacetylase (PgdA/CDA1 family)
VLRRVTGRVPALLRPPYGGRSPETLTWLGERDTTVVLWDVDPDDWAMPGAAAIADVVLAQVGNGSIVLMHDAGGDRSQTVEALPRILDSLLGQGYAVVPVEQLLGGGQSSSGTPG